MKFGSALIVSWHAVDCAQLCMDMYMDMPAHQGVCTETHMDMCTDMCMVMVINACYWHVYTNADRPCCGHPCGHVNGHFHICGCAYRNVQITVNWHSHRYVCACADVHVHERFTGVSADLCLKKCAAIQQCL